MSLISDELVEKLIEEIERRPALYKKSLKEYADAIIKKKLWSEVCEAVVPEWSLFDSEEKTKQGNEIQKRWNNLRTCFRRELNAQKNTKSGQSASKRRKYVYFDKMLFLLPCIENRPTEGNIGSPHSPEDDDCEEDADTFVASPTSTPIPHPQRKKKVAGNCTASECDKALLQALAESKDEDTNFAMSIVPSLQSLTAEEKVDAKINILKIFKEILAKRRRQPTAHILQSTSSSSGMQDIEYVTSPGSSNSSIQAYCCNFTEDSELIELQ